MKRKVIPIILVPLIAAGLIVAAIWFLSGSFGADRALTEYQNNRTDRREDYASDAVFANFRNVALAGLGQNALYRSSSPIDPGLGRAAYADALAKEHKVRTVIGLADSPAAAEGYLPTEDLGSPYYQALYRDGQAIVCGLTADFGSTEFRQGLAEGLRFLSTHRGPYLIYSAEGTDRAGFVCALLECLMGASFEEMAADYMASYANIYHLSPDSETYAAILERHFLPILYLITGAGEEADLSQTDLSGAAAQYIVGLGLSGGEVMMLRTCLSRNYVVLDGSAPISATDRVIPHRGASGEEIEHTITAYDLALEYGATQLEQDIVTSKDGTLYVSHDLSAKRITGVDKLYADMTDREIDALRTEDGQRILKLSDVFDRYGSSVTYVVELKDKGAQAELFAALVKEYGMEDHIVVQCLEPSVLEALEAVFPDMPKMYLVSDRARFNAGLELNYVDILAVSKNLMSQENCDIAHDCGKRFSVWTLDSTEEIEAAIALNVDSYFTNYTGRALTLEREHE